MGVFFLFMTGLKSEENNDNLLVGNSLSKKDKQQGIKNNLKALEESVAVGVGAYQFLYMNAAMSDYAALISIKESKIDKNIITYNYAEIRCYKSTKSIKSKEFSELYSKGTSGKFDSLTGIVFADIDDDNGLYNVRFYKWPDVYKRFQYFEEEKLNMTSDLQNRLDRYEGSITDIYKNAYSAFKSKFSFLMSYPNRPYLQNYLDLGFEKLNKKYPLTAPLIKKAYDFHLQKKNIFIDEKGLLRIPSQED